MGEPLMQTDKKQILNRLTTIDGHLKGIRKMVEADQQLERWRRASSAHQSRHPAGLSLTPVPPPRQRRSPPGGVAGRPGRPKNNVSLAPPSAFSSRSPAMRWYSASEICASHRVASMLTVVGG
jgi:hypothetical protein